MTLVSTRIAQRKLQASKAKDRRGASRYGVKLAFRYRASGRPLNSAWKHGHTLNMSASGVLIEIPETKPVGSILELAIDWPGLYYDKPMVRLFLTGAVSRTDGRSIALRTLRHEFCDVPASVARAKIQPGNRAVA